MGRRILLAAAVALAGCGGNGAQSAGSCAIDRGQIPQWAATGFSDPHPSMPHVVGDGGLIAALVFGDPLVAPPDSRRANKILWVARDPIDEPTSLKIHAVSGGRVVDRTLSEGVGPSIVDLPAGCWKLKLTWGPGEHQHDTLSLAYKAT